MRILIISCLLLICSAKVQSQKPATIPENMQYGIYFNFFEFQANKPSVTSAFKPVYRGGFHSYPAYRLQIKNARGKYEVIDKPIWGYFDSINIYIYHKKGFNKADQFGRYCVFEALKKNMPDIGILNQTINYSDVKIKYLDFILDTYSGKIVEATKKNILEMRMNQIL